MLAAPKRRDGVTLLEVLTVFAVLIILGAAVVPTLNNFMRDTNVKGAADLCVARLADARSYAIEEGRAYRFSSNPEGTRIRVSPDELDGSGVPLESPELPPHIVELDLPKGVILAPNGQQAGDDDGWITLITYQPDGTCKETNSSDFKLTELGTVPYTVQVRNLTGAVTVNMTTTGAK